MTRRTNKERARLASGSAEPLGQREFAGLRAIMKPLKAQQREARQRAKEERAQLAEQRQKDFAQRVAEVHAEEQRQAASSSPAEPLEPARVIFPSLRFTAGRKRR